MLNMFRIRTARCAGPFFGLVAILVVTMACQGTETVKTEPGENTANTGKDWPQYRGPERTGKTSESNWTTKWSDKGPKEIWSAELGDGFSSFSVVGDRLYTMGNKGGQDIVWCLNADTGKEIWKHTYKASAARRNGGPGMTPTVDPESNLVFTLSRKGDMYCLKADTGDVVWSKNANDFNNPGQWGWSCSPMIKGDMLIWDLGVIVAMNKKTGDVIWKSKKHPAAYSSPYLFTQDGKEYLATFPGDGVLILDPKTGKEFGLYPLKIKYGVSAVMPIYHDGYVFVAGGYRNGSALVKVTPAPKEVWRKRNHMSNHMNTSILIDGYLYGVDGNRLQCIDFKTGEEQWAQRGYGKGSLIAADGKLIILGQKGDLAISEASPKGLKMISKAKVLDGLCWTIPVLAHGKLYCRTHEGRLICLDLSK
ncbi:MAG: PQQ-binding-like beta-propeller repeat protein [Phycisphaerae bacterium]